MVVCVHLPDQRKGRTSPLVGPAILQRKLAFTIGQRTAALDADHLHVPPRRYRLDAFDHILGIAVWATERFSHWYRLFLW